MLTATETLHSLNHSKTSFRTYRRDTYFKAFLLPEATWDSLAANYGQVEDVVGTTTTRSAVDKCEDLKDFLLPILDLVDRGGNQTFKTGKHGRGQRLGVVT